MTAHPPELAAEARKVAMDLLLSVEHIPLGDTEAELAAYLPVLLAFAERVRAEDAQRIKAQVGRAVHAEAEVTRLKAELEEFERQWLEHLDGCPGAQVAK